MSSDKNNRLTSKDRLLVDKIIVGNCKMIYLVTSRDVQSTAKASRLVEIKSRAYTAIDNMSMNGNFRPSDVRGKLPIELQNIQGADITDILSSYIRIGKIKKSDPIKNGNRRGHPRKSDEDKKNMSGPKSNYQQSDFDKELDRVLSNIEVVKKIFRVLYNSGLILRLESYVELWTYYVMKNNDMDKAWNICKSVFPLSRKDSKFDEEYTSVRNIDSGFELEQRARNRAKYRIGSLSTEYYAKLFKKGAYFFRI